MNAVLPFAGFLEILRSKGYGVGLNEHVALANLLDALGPHARRRIRRRRRRARRAQRGRGRGHPAAVRRDLPRRRRRRRASNRPLGRRAADRCRGAGPGCWRRSARPRSSARCSGRLYQPPPPPPTQPPVPRPPRRSPGHGAASRRHAGRAAAARAAAAARSAEAARARAHRRNRRVGLSGRARRSSGRSRHGTPRTRGCGTPGHRRWPPRPGRTTSIWCCAIRQRACHEPTSRTPPRFSGAPSRLTRRPASSTCGGACA